MVHSYSRDAQSVRAQSVVLNRYRAQSCGAQSVPSRNFLSVARSLFPKIYLNFVTFDRFIKTKKKKFYKIRKKSEKINVFGQIDKSIVAKKSYVTGFFVEQFFFTILLITFWNY